MVKVRALLPCFIGNCYHEEGSEFEYPGELTGRSTVVVALEDLDPVDIPRPSKAVKDAAAKSAALSATSAGQKQRVEGDAALAAAKALAFAEGRAAAASDAKPESISSTPPTKPTKPKK